MNDTAVARELGAIGARLDSHDTQLGDLKSQVTAGFEGMYERIDKLAAAENRRKGAISLLKIVAGSGVLVGIVETIKVFFRGHA